MIHDTGSNLGKPGSLRVRKRRWFPARAWAVSTIATPGGKQHRLLASLGGGLGMFGSVDAQPLHTGGKLSRNPRSPWLFPPRQNTHWEFGNPLLRHCRAASQVQPKHEPGIDYTHRLTIEKL